MKAQVYTEPWINQMRAKVGGRPKQNQPFPFLVATDDNLAEMRANIESFVSLIPTSCKLRVIGNLRVDKGFEEAYNELIVGQILRNRGLKTEYEKPFANQTPDWYVSTNDDGFNFIVEVFTDNVPAHQEREGQMFSDLTCRLRNIPLDFSIKLLRPMRPIKLDHGINKRIVLELKKWLTKINPADGAKFGSHGLDFEVLARDRGYSGIMLWSICGFRAVNDKPLRENLKTKVRKYKNIVTDQKMPFVVAVKADITTGYDCESLEDILHGRQEHVLEFDKSSLEKISESQRRRHDGLFVEAPTLSGVLWIRRIHGEEFEMEFYPNPHAPYPVTPGLL